MVSNDHTPHHLVTSNDRHLLSAVIQSNISHITHIAFCSNNNNYITYFRFKKNEIESNHDIITKVSVTDTTN